MARRKSNFYVVWKGVEPGVYDNWDDCRKQTANFEGALYKSFATRQQAEEAYNDQPWKYIGQQAKSVVKPAPAIAKESIIQESIAVDAACSGNPGLMEYRGVYVRTGQELFRQGPFEEGTNNIGEFLALVHGMGYLKQHNLQMPIYSDSITGLAWVRAKKAKTKLEQTERNAPIFHLVERAERWLQTNGVPFKLLKWETDDWGEIPADFGRKK